jgi:exopolysaccharide biosynthesis polyprenyl glycosylphosphotransferase
VVTRAIFAYKWPKSGASLDQLSAEDQSSAKRADGPLTTSATGRHTKKWLRVGAVGGCALGDGLMISGAALLAALARFESVKAGNTSDLLLVILPAYYMASLLFHSYRLTNLLNPLKSVIRALLPLTVAMALTAGAAYAFKVGANYSRLESGYMLAFSVIALMIWRLVWSSVLSRFEPMIAPKVVVLTDGPPPRSLQAWPTVDVKSLSESLLPNDPQFLDQLFRQFHGFDRIVLSLSDGKVRAQWIDIMRRTGLDAEVREQQFSGIQPLGLRKFSGSPTLVISRGPLNPAERLTKRAFDLLALLIFAPLLIPFLCLIALAIKIDSPGPALFVQKRVGQNNGQFNCYKFRTMRAVSGDGRGDRSASRDDDRLTRIGPLLRRTSADELPQLWNVFKGDMSLVGPRPHALGSTAEGQLFWEAAQGYWLRHAVIPGMTGLAQVRGLRGATDSAEELKERVATDLEYANSYSLWLDIKILFKTWSVLIHPKAY